MECDAGKIDLVVPGETLLYKRSMAARLTPMPRRKMLEALFSRYVDRSRR